MALTIAIDGPVGAGKSTIAKALAGALGILYLDTGAMYRALALGVLRASISPIDQAAVEALCDTLSVTVTQRDGQQHTWLGGEDVTDLIRTPEVSSATSCISRYAVVRTRMVSLQQAYAQSADMVLDGRDIGTRVLPFASHKFYLDADATVRAKRRHAELSANGIDTLFETVLADLIARDAQDAGRAVDPLRKADDAMRIDTGDMTAEAVVSHLVSIVRGES